MKITIHKAHGEVLEQRQRELAQLMQPIAQFEVLRMEDKRQTDALVKVAGFNPEDYSSYKLVRDGENFLLDLQEKQANSAAGPVAVPAVTEVVQAPEPVKHVNGAA
jgi:hypothetical protein